MFSKVEIEYQTKEMKEKITFCQIEYNNNRKSD